MTEIRDVVQQLEAQRNDTNRAGMARYGINTAKAYGISVVALRQMAKGTGKDHALARDLGNTGMHEARILASFVDQPKLVTEAQREAWVRDFDSWDLCDQACGLFAATPFAHAKAAQWASRPEEFVRRAALSLIATLAVHDKKAPDATFVAFLPLIREHAGDDRNFVRKAVNWALRSIGKRNLRLNEAAIACAKEI